MLTLSEELLILMTKIVIEGKKQMRLNELFDAFRKRGIYLDKQSQKSVVEFYEKLNLIEKKAIAGMLNMSKEFYNYLAHRTVQHNSLNILIRSKMISPSIFFLGLYTRLMIYLQEMSEIYLTQTISQRKTNCSLL